jgi:hypothetical protein
MNNLSLVLLALAGVVALTSQAAADPRPPVYNCPKVKCAPKIDGKLDDAAWKLAPEVTLVMTCTGEPATKHTTARMCWDDDCLYVGFDCADTDIFATMTNRGDWIFREEVVEAFLCPDCDLTRHYEINLSPRNVIFEAYIVNTGSGDEIDYGWRCQGLRTAVSVDGTIEDRTDTDRGWTAEYAIPFAALKRCAPKPGERWRANLYRIDLFPEPKEFQAWSPTLTPRPAFHVPNRFGTVFFTESE